MNRNWDSIHSQLRESRYDGDAGDQTAHLIDKSLLFSISEQNERYFEAQRAQARQISVIERHESQLFMEAESNAQDAEKYRVEFENTDLELKRVFYKLKQFCRVYGITAAEESIGSMLGAVFARIRSFDTPQKQRELMTTSVLEPADLQVQNSENSVEYEPLNAQNNELARKLALENDNLKRELEQSTQPLFLENQELETANYELQSRIVALEDALLKRSQITYSEQLAEPQTSPLNGGECVSMLRFLASVDSGLADLARLAGKQDDVIASEDDYETGIENNLEWLREFVIDMEQLRTKVERTKDDHATEFVLKTCIEEWKSQLSASKVDNSGNANAGAIELLMDQQYSDNILTIEQRLEQIEKTVGNYNGMETALVEVTCWAEQCQNVCNTVFEKTRALHKELEAKEREVVELQEQLIQRNTHNYINSKRGDYNAEILQPIHSKLLEIAEILELDLKADDSLFAEQRISMICDELCSEAQTREAELQIAQAKLQQAQAEIESQSEELVKSATAAQEREARDEEQLYTLEKLENNVRQKMGTIDDLMDLQDYSKVEATLCAVLRQFGKICENEELDEKTHKQQVESSEPSEQEQGSLCTEMLEFLNSVPHVEQPFDEFGDVEIAECCQQVLSCDKDVFIYLLETCGDALEQNGCLQALREYCDSLPESLSD